VYFKFWKLNAKKLPNFLCKFEMFGYNNKKGDTEGFEMFELMRETDENF